MMLIEPDLVLPGPRQSDTITITQKDCGSTVELTKGDILILRLEEQPGTGYSWEILKNDAELLKPLGKPTSESRGEAFPGATVDKVFRFEAQKTGSSSLELGYIRPWQKGKAPVKTCHFMVEVH